MRRRTLPLLGVLALALLALAHRSTVQAYLYGVGDSTRQLVGQQAPELPGGLQTLDGAPLRLAGLRGEVVLLHFWTYG